MKRLRRAHPYTGDRPAPRNDHPHADLMSMRYGYIGLGHLGGHLAASLARAGFPIDGLRSRPKACRTACEARRAIGCKPAETSPRKSMRSSPACRRRKSRARCSTPCSRRRRSGTDWIEMSTLGRDGCSGLAATCRGQGRRMLECPVTGGVHRAATRRHHRSRRRRRRACSKCIARHLQRWAARSSTWGHWARRR